MMPAQLLVGSPGFFHISRMIAVLLAAAALLAAPPLGRAETPSELQQQGYANDFGDFIEQESKNRIEVICGGLEEKTGDRLLIVTVESTANLSPGQFAEALRNSWIAQSDARERTVIFVVNGQGRPGFGIGRRLESILTHEKLDAIMRSSFVGGGDNYGPKIADVAEKIAEALQQGSNAGSAPGNAKKPASAVDQDPILAFTLLGTVLWLAILVRAAGAGNWRVVAMLQVVACGAVYLLIQWYGPVEGRSASARTSRNVTLGMVAVSWLLGALNAALIYRKIRMRAVAGALGPGGIGDTRGVWSPGASAPGSSAVPGKGSGIRATPRSLSSYFLWVGLYGLLHSLRALSKITDAAQATGFLVGFLFCAAYLYVSFNCARLLRDRPGAIKALLYVSSAFCVLGVLAALPDQHLVTATLYGLQLLLNWALLRGVKRLAAEARSAAGGAVVTAP